MAEVDDWAAESEPKAEEPVEVIPEKTWVDIKLFNKWSTEDVQVPYMSLQDYIAVKEKFSKFVPHSAGRYDHLATYFFAQMMTHPALFECSMRTNFSLYSA